MLCDGLCAEFEIVDEFRVGGLIYQRARGPVLYATYSFPVLRDAI